MDVQSAANLNIPEGSVRNIHDKDKRLLWSAVGYNVRYDGDTTQQTYTGKNKMPVQSVDLTDNRIKEFVIALPAGTYTYSFDLDSFEVGTNTSFSIYSQFYLSTGTWKDNNISGPIDSTTTLGRKSYTFTLDVDAIIDLNHLSNIRIPLTQYNNGAKASISNIMIEPGSTATTYEQYVGGIPAPNPDYPQDVNVVQGKQDVLVSAKNLLSVSFAVAGGVPSDIPTNTFVLDRENQRFFRCDFPTLLPPGTYTISFDISDNNTLSGVSFNIFNKSETSISGAYNLSGSHYSGTFTFNESVKIIRWFIASNESNDKHATISNVQVEAGSTATAYEMYQGQQTFPVDLIGKNLFDKNGKITADSWLRNDGLSTTGATGWSVTDYIPISPNTSYTISGMASGSGVNPSRCYYDKDKNFISGVKHGGANPFTDAAPANAYYLRDSFMTDDINTLQLEAGSATPYAPYYNYELCKIGNYQDYIFKSSGKNLFDGVLEVGIINGITGLDQANSNYVRAEDYIPVDELAYYRISTDNANISSVFVYEYKADKTYNLTTNKSLTLTDVYGTEKDTAFIRFRPNYQTTDTSIKFQVEKGTVVTPYEPYGTDWYVRKEIGKQVLEASDIVGVASSYTNIEYARANKPVDSIIYDNSRGYSNVAIASFATQQVSTGGGYDNKDFIGKYIVQAENLRYYVGFPKNTGLQNMQTKLEGEVFYCALVSPAYTKITDNTLIGQLNAVHDWLKRYDYYGVVSGNLPIIINRSGII